MGKQNSLKDRVPAEKANWDSWLYRLGCPVWACKEWGNSVYPKGIASDRVLTWYSHSFPTVEGNSTFYALPDESTFAKWRDQSAEGFKFCFKFPRSISHDRMLLRCDDLLSQWLDRLAILREANKLGPTFLQLGPGFSGRQFTSLEGFLRQLPRDWDWSIELRHRDWFDQDRNEKKLVDLLIELEIDQVLFDSRPLNSMDASDSSEQQSQTRKPKSPFRATVTGKQPMVRLIGRNRLDEIESYWEEWAKQVAAWIRQGLHPWVFTHAPDDRFAPDLAKEFHRLLLQELPDHPGLPNPLEKGASDGGEVGSGEGFLANPLGADKVSESLPAADLHAKQGLEQDAKGPMRQLRLF